MPSPRRVLIAAGGTGGHVYPALAVAGAVRARGGDATVEFVGNTQGFEGRAVPAAGFPLSHVEAQPLARKLSLQVLRLPLVLARSTAKLRRRMHEHEVTVAAVFGGYVSVPLALAARVAGVPLVVHEQNSVPGLANRLAARWARHVAVTFPASAARFPHPERVTVTGNPVRPGFSAEARDRARLDGLGAFGLEPHRRTLLVFGGSQGARQINDALVAATPLWRNPAMVQVLHVAGRRGYADARAAWERASTGELVVRCLEFVEEMELAYGAADVALCRAGASTLAELTVVGLPSVLVPYPHATNDHQTANAKDLAGAGAAVVVADADLDGQSLVDACESLLLDDEHRRRAGSAALALARPDAAEAVAALVVEAAEERERS